MVTGIESFKEWFKSSEEQYTIIGGTVCDILMTEEGLDFRKRDYIGVRPQCGQPSVNLRQAPDQVND